MNKYAVTIRATVTKTLTIEADTVEEAVAEAHDLFTVRYEDDIDEDYTEEMLDIERIKE